MKISAQLLALAISAFSLSADARMQRASSHRHLARSVKRGDVAYSALMYWGKQNGQAGACGEVHADDQPLVGLQTSMFGAGGECGKFVEIRNTANNRTVTAPVYDSCKGCADSNDLVSSIATFQGLEDDLDVGVLDVVWTFVNAPAKTVAKHAAPKVETQPKKVSISKVQQVTKPTPEEKAPMEHKATEPVLKQIPEDDCEEYEGDAPAKKAEEPKIEEKFQEAPASESKIQDNARVAMKAPEEKVEAPVPAPSPPSAPAASSEGFKMTHNLKGQELLNFFTMETASGDNEGFANWVNDGSLQYVNGQGNVVFATDSTPVVDSRKTTRAVSKQTFNKGLFISQITHMPETFGSWPSFWIVGAQDWPASGEIDVLEGVGSFTHNAASVHTNAGCSMPASILSQTTSKFMLDSPQQTNCDAQATDTQGCGLRDQRPNTFGPGFNKVGGAYVAVHITDDFVKVFQWAGDSAPADVKNGSPAPSTWTEPSLYLPNTSCNISQHFYDLKLVFSTNVCGRWPSDLWNSDASYAGQMQSSAQATGVGSCYEFAHSHGQAWADAFFEIASISIFE